MSARKPLKRFKFTYQTRFSEDYDYTKTLYATSARTAWVKFNNFIDDHGILLHDASIESVE